MDSVTPQERPGYSFDEETGIERDTTCKGFGHSPIGHDFPCIQCGSPSYFSAYHNKWCCWICGRLFTRQDRLRKWAETWGREYHEEDFDDDELVIYVEGGY